MYPLVARQFLVAREALAALLAAERPLACNITIATAIRK
jgi:hypothetical protein